MPKFIYFEVYRIEINCLANFINFPRDEILKLKNLYTRTFWYVTPHGPSII